MIGFWGKVRHLKWMLVLRFGLCSAIEPIGPTSREHCVFNYYWYRIVIFRTYHCFSQKESRALCLGYPAYK